MTSPKLSVLHNKSSPLFKFIEDNSGLSFCFFSLQTLFAQVDNSVLSSGDWYKFKIEQTGVHILNKSFLNSIGMNTDGIDPRTIKVYGNGGKALPFKNIDNTVFDLMENSIQVVGELDGSFDTNDFILFYGTNAKGYHDTCLLYTSPSPRD